MIISLSASNRYLNLIQEAITNYVPCTQANCSCNSRVIIKDLAAFQKTGITAKMIEAVRERGTKYQIIDHKIYRQKECMFPARCSGIEHFMELILENLPNMEMIINCRDWPQILNTHTVGPVFSFSKTKDYSDIMYPVWGFWEGGPAISLYPTGLGRWDRHRLSIKKAANGTAWEEKQNKAFFRGSRTSSERDPLILLSRKYPELADAQYTKNQAWKSMADTLNMEPAKEISLEEHCKYKYLFNFRGVAASFRFKHLFLCKSLVFHVGDEWQEFFYESLKPWVHYVPIKTDSTIGELKEIIEFFKEHDDVAQEIAQRGFAHIWKHLRMKDVQCYWRSLLKKYSKLIKYDVILDKTLIPIKNKLNK